MRVFEPTTNIPPELAEQLGKVIIEYAYLEHCLVSLIHLLAGTGPKIGRIVIKASSAEESLKMIQDLLYPSRMKN